MKCKRQYPLFPRLERGLTLIELLVAIGILAFIAVLGWRGLETLIRTRSSLDQELEQTRNLQIIFAQLQNDCAHIVSASQIDGQTPLLLEPNRLSLVRSVSLEAAPTQLQWVSYRLQKSLSFTRFPNESTNWINHKYDHLARIRSLSQSE